MRSVSMASTRGASGRASTVLAPACSAMRRAAPSVAAAAASAAAPTAAAVALGATQASLSSAIANHIAHRRRERTYLRRFCLQVALCLAAGSLLCEHRGAFVGPPGAAASGPRLRGKGGRSSDPGLGRRAEAEAGEEGAGTGGGSRLSEEEAERLRAKVAELERRLSGGAPASAGAGAGRAGGQVFAAERRVTMPVEVQEAWEAIKEDLSKSFQEIADAKLGMDGSRSFVIQKGDNTASNPIYKRKYEVLGATLVQQDMYMKAFGKTVKVAKKLKSVETMIDLMRNGIKGKVTKREVNEATELLTRSGDGAAVIFFRELLPEVTDDPVANTVAGLVTTVLLLGVTAAIFLCFLPPVNLADLEE